MGGNGSKFPRVQARVDPEFKTRITRRAEEEQVPEAVVIRRALARYLSLPI